MSDTVCPPLFHFVRKPPQLWFGNRSQTCSQIYPFQLHGTRFPIIHGATFCTRTDLSHGSRSRSADHGSSNFLSYFRTFALLQSAQGLVKHSVVLVQNTRECATPPVEAKTRLCLDFGLLERSCRKRPSRRRRIDDQSAQIR